MALKTCGFGILGVGKDIPEIVVTNADIEKVLDTSDEWITTRTGIKERRRVADGENTTDMGTRAARAALAAAGVEPGEVDLLICCTCSPDVAVPSAACMIQDRLGIADRCAAFDLNAACTGFIYGLSVATAFMRAGVYRKALVVGAETLSRWLDVNDRGTYVLFGDGAGAAVVGPTEPGRGLVGEYLRADGSLGPTLMVHETGTRVRTEAEMAENPSRIVMNGREVFKFATAALGEATVEALKAAGDNLTLADLDHVFPHQANARIIESAAKRVGLPMDKVYVNIHKYGNTSSASIPIALAEALEEGRLKPGDLLSLVAFGGGLTYGSSIWVW